MDAELLWAVVGAAFSLAASYIPGFKDWWGKLAPDVARAYMGGALVVAVGAAYAGSCYLGWTVYACGDWQAAVWSLVVAALANQSTYQLSPRKWAGRK